VKFKCMNLLCKGFNIPYDKKKFWHYKVVVILLGGLNLADNILVNACAILDTFCIVS